jgi:hypothetical protein
LNVFLHIRNLLETEREREREREREKAMFSENTVITKCYDTVVIKKLIRVFESLKN